MARGEVGEQTFSEVEALTAGGKMKRLAAFQEVAKRTGRNVGTVSANYYRIARKRNVPLRPRRGRAVGGAGVQAALAAAVRKIEAALKAQAEELANLRKENERFAKLRRLLAR
jgi:hypothetical protein